MRRPLIALLCLIIMIVVLGGCVSGEAAVDSEQVKIETPTETPEETETPTESPEVTEEAQEELKAPIEIDTSVAIEPGSRIAVIAKSVEGGYWRTMRTQMEEAVSYLNREYGFEGSDRLTLTYEGPRDEADVTTQINTFDAVLAENPDVICLAALDMDSCQAQLETARDNGIPVIVFDSGVSSDLVNAICITDNEQAAAQGADKLCEAVGDSGKVAVFAHENYTQTSADRVKGFQTQINNNHKEVTIDTISYTNKEENMEDMVRTTLENQPDIKGIFCTSEAVSEAVLNVVADYSDRDLKIIGFDMGSQQKKAIVDGIEYGAIVQDIYQMAYETIWMAAQSTPEEFKLENAEMVVPHIWADKTVLETSESNQNFYE